MSKFEVENKKTYDVLGIVLSIFCGIHCLITPLLIISAPTFGKVLQSGWVHTSMIAFMAFAFYQSIYKHYKLHKSKLTLSLGLTGFLLILVSYVNEIFGHGHEDEHHAHGDESLMIYIAISGAILLVSSHILNLRKCKCLSSGDVC